MTCRGGKILCIFPYTEVLSALLHVAFSVGFRTLCLEVDNINIYILDANQGCSIAFGKSVGRNTHTLAFTRKIGNQSGSEDLRSFKNSNGTNLLNLTVLAADSK